MFPLLVSPPLQINNNIHRTYTKITKFSKLLPSPVIWGVGGRGTHHVVLTRTRSAGISLYPTRSRTRVSSESGGHHCPKARIHRVSQSAGDGVMIRAWPIILPFDGSLQEFCHIFLQGEEWGGLVRAVNR